MVVSSEVASELASLAQIGPGAGADRDDGRNDNRTSRERDRRPAGSEEGRGAARRAPRLGRERARDQRQRLGLGRRPRDRPAGTPSACSAEARVAVRVLGRRGARAHRLDELRGQPEYLPALPDSRRHQPRHGRVAELRPHRLRGRGPAAGLARGSRRRSARTSQGGGFPSRRIVSAAAPTMRRSRGPGSRSAASSRARTSSSRPSWPSASAARRAGRSTPATTSPATRSRTSTSASSSRWPTRPRSSPCASRASVHACPRTTSASA